MRSILKARVILPALVALVGFGLGFQVWNSVRVSDGLAAAIRDLPVITQRAQLDPDPIGREILIDGQIAAENPSRTFTNTKGEQRQFVVYEIGQFISATPNAQGEIATTIRWSDPIAPAIAVQLQDGVVRLATGDYKIDGWESSATVDTTTGVRGYAVGDRVLIAGTVIDSADGPAIRARELSSHTPSSYVAAHADQRGRGIYILVAQFLTGCGSVFAALATLLAIRAWRRAARDRRGEAALVASQGQEGRA